MDEFTYDEFEEWVMETPDGNIEYYDADVTSTSEYYPYGMTLRSESDGGNYRYGFNGMEGDDEIKGDGNSFTTEFRMYDSRVARWLSSDPVMHHMQSPYNAFDGNPVYYSDPNGADAQGDPLKKGLIIIDSGDSETERKQGIEDNGDNVNWEYYVAKNSVDGLEYAAKWLQENEGSAVMYRMHGSLSSTDIPEVLTGGTLVFKGGNGSKIYINGADMESFNYLRSDAAEQGIEFNHEYLASIGSRFQDENANKIDLLFALEGLGQAFGESGICAVSSCWGGRTSGGEATGNAMYNLMSNKGLSLYLNADKSIAFGGLDISYPEVNETFRGYSMLDFPLTTNKDYDWGWRKISSSGNQMIGGAIQLNSSGKLITEIAAGYNYEQLRSLSIRNHSISYKKWLTGLEEKYPGKNFPTQ